MTHTINDIDNTKSDIGRQFQPLSHTNLFEHTLLGAFQLTISRFNWIKWSYATKRTRKNKHVYRGCFQFVWELIKRFHKYIYPIRNVKIYRIFVLGFYARRKRSFAFARFPFTKVLSGDVYLQWVFFNWIFIICTLVGM